jgi:hypothetical protein
MEDFDSAAALRRVSGDTFDWQVPEGWQQGRGAWGGLVAGALVQAVTLSEPDAARRVRAVSAQLVAPAVVGAHRIEVACLRRGSATSTWTTVLTDGEDRLVATLTAILGTGRDLDDAPDVASWRMAPMPDLPALDLVPELPLGPPLGPVFARRLRMHPVSGVPTMGGPPETAGWVGYRVPPIPSAAALIALVDAWWPASLPAMPKMRPVATITIAANLMVDPADVGFDQMLVHHGFVSAAQDGYISETRRLWTADGRLAVENLQSIVVIA